MQLAGLALSIVLAACGGATADAHLATAQDSLASSDFAKAISESEAGLALGAEAATSWRLELVHLEAVARSGDATAASEALERLASAEGSQVKSSHYVSTADQLKGGGAAAGAITLLDLGLKRFPNDGDLTKAIEQAKEAGGEDELEALKSLGYLGD